MVRAVEHTGGDTNYTHAEIEAMVEEHFATLPRRSAAEWMESFDGDTDEWIYPGLVCDSYTMIVGKPKAGKSMLAVNIAAAFNRGGSVLGIEPAKVDGSRNVLILTTEANGPKENVNRLKTLDANLDTIFIDRIDSRGVPERSYMSAQLGNIGLVIVDNVLGLCRGVDINKPEAVTALTEVAERFNIAGVPVVFIHHQNKGYGSDPIAWSMGNNGIAGLMRHIVGVEKTEQGTKLKTAGNIAGAETITIRFNDDYSAEVIDRQEATAPSEKRASVTLDKNERIARLAAASVATTVKGVAEEIAEDVGLSPSTLRKWKLAKLVEMGLLAERKNGRGGLYSLGDKLT